MGKPPDDIDIDVVTHLVRQRRTALAARRARHLNRAAR